MTFSIDEIIKITAAQLLAEGTPDSKISEIFFDTRKGIYGPEALFIAIDGKNADGHQYISVAYESLGTRNFLVSKSVDTKKFPNANFILSSNVVKSLHDLAKFQRSKTSVDVIGITGSNGKTIVKEWIFQLCSEYFDIIRSPGSYNSQIGVPLSVLAFEDYHNLGIFEAGISASNEMAALEEIIKPSLGIFTNIGEAHSAGFRSMDEKIAEKAILFSNCMQVIYCRDHEKIHTELSKLDTELISWSTEKEEADYQVSYHDQEIIINKVSYSIPFSDDLSRENATFAIITSLILGVKNLNTQDLFPIKMRLEMKQGINNSLLINDTYNSDYNALASALKILGQQQKRQRNTLILSQIEESNLSPEESRIRLEKLIASHDIHRLITVGEDLMPIDFEGDYHKYPSTESFLNGLRFLRFQNENVLIKGARKFNLERVFDQLSVKVHQTILEIDLEAMRHNLMIYRSLLEVGTNLMVVLKASGYGSGSKELSRFLAFQRVDYIAVAYVDEGIELRKSGIDIPIMVMNPEESGFESMIEYRLEPEIYSFDQIINFASYLREENYPVHLKIETGMHRLGLEEDILEDLGQFLSAEKRIEVKSIFSHLVGSDDPGLDSFSMDQIDSFTRSYEFIADKLGYRPIRHMLNSNGISRFKEYQFEMVRLGIGLHGISDDPDMSNKLQKVQTLKTRIAQVKEIKVGDTVGYNRMYTASKEQTIATINIGYADGLPRNAGNGSFKVLVNGKYPAPIIGNVCMDMCMIDLSGVYAREGDEVIIFGKEWPIENLAVASGTIPYEILTRLSTRIHRIFSRE